MNSYNTKMPRFHSSLARSLYERMEQDEHMRNLDKTPWYACNLQHVDEELCTCFVQLTCDEETQTFLDDCFDKSDWIFTQIYHVIMKALLTWFMTNTSINGFLNRGSMFVFSSSHVRALLGVSESFRGDRLLDIGAGDGGVTSKMAPIFHEVHVTEMSPVMRKVLNTRGYRVLDTDTWADDGAPVYDVISCLNVLDRCEDPMKMLRDIKRKLRPGTGRLLLALVLPYSAYVESGASQRYLEVTISMKLAGKDPQTMDISGATFEEQVVSVRNLLATQGLQVVSWSRVPYLCEGDLKQAYYWLHDAIFVLRAVDTVGPEELVASCDCHASPVLHV